jgi:creatinine amidohydrolase
MRHYVLSETNWKTVKDREYELAILPWGATEAHNFHLPFGTDNFETELIAIESARLAWEKKARAIVLPTIPFGVNTGQKDIRLTINLNPSTQAIILKDVIESLIHHKIYKLLIMNGHGGNDFRQMIREIGYQYPQMFISTCNWYMTVEKMKIFEKLVLPLEEAGDGNFKKFSIKAFNEDWAWAERKWSRVTADTGIGNPKKASKDKGERYFNEVTEKISKLMIELAKANPDDLYI